MNQPYIVLVGVDFSTLANRALQEAFSIASRRAAAEVHVISVLPIASDDPTVALAAFTSMDQTQLLEEGVERLRSHVQQELQRFCTAHPSANAGFRIVSHAHFDTAAHGIVQLASDVGAHLIVIGTRNPKRFERLLLGSVAEGTVRDACCPVLVIPAPPEADPSTVITPPCPECLRLRARTASAGRDLWCAQHSERHGRRHTYHQTDRSGAESNLPLVFR
ncbi:MAG: universal stress protein [Myxococcales bacterium]